MGVSDLSRDFVKSFLNYNVNKLLETLRFKTLKEFVSHLLRFGLRQREFASSVIPLIKQ